MRIVFYALGALLLLVVAGGIYAYLRLKRYLASTQEGAQSTMSEIVEEIDSYQEKTQ